MITQRESQTGTGMLREKIIRHWVILLFLFLGVLFLAIGIVFFMRRDVKAWFEMVYIITFEVSIIFFTATIIKTLLLKEFGNRAVETMERLGEETQDSINNRLNATFELLRNAEYNGIINILPPYRDTSKNQKGEERGQLSSLLLRDALEKTEKVKIFSISGRSFLWHREKTGYYEIFWNKARSEKDYKVQILLASPNGYGAQIRGKRENPEDTDHISDYIKMSQKGIKELNSKREIIKTKYYNFIPQAGFVITDDKMFFEPYHLADHTFLKKRREEQFTDNTPWCGGRVPILVVKKGSTLYDAMDNYFDWLWEHNDPEIFNDEFREYFNVDDKETSTTTDKVGEEHG